MHTVRSRWLLPVFLLLGLFLSACAGNLPPDINLEDLATAAPGDVPNATEIEFTGTVEAIEAEAWTIDGQPVLLTPTTEVKDDIAIGDFVKVHASLDADGNLVARQIEREDEVEFEIEVEVERRDDELEFVGTVETIDGDAWTVAGQTFTVTAATEIKGDIAIGDFVKVHAFPTDQGLIAREIELANPTETEDHDDDDTFGGELEFFGVVEAIGADAWVIDGLTIFLTPATEIKGNPQVGDMVKVHAHRAEDGSLVAREIEPAEDDDFDDNDDEHGQEEVEFKGKVEAMGDASWTVDGVTVLVTSSTEIEEAIQVGDRVEVKAVADQDGNLVALRIELEDDDYDDMDDDRDHEGDDRDDDRDDDHDEDHDDDRDDDRDDHDRDDDDD